MSKNKKTVDKIIQTADAVVSMDNSKIKTKKGKPVEVEADTIEGLRAEAQANKKIVLEVVAGTIAVPTANTPKGTFVDPSGGDTFDLEIK